MGKDKSEKREKKERKEKKERNKSKDVDDLPLESEVATLDLHADADEEHETTKALSDEIEIDLNAGPALNKKQQRLLKKGKLDLAKLERKQAKVKPLTEDGKEPEPDTPKRSPFGVWIGNMSFDTTRDDLVRFIVAKTSELEPSVVEEDMSRINIPKKEKKIKGFAYIDLPSAEHVASVVAISESLLNGRKLLIKDSTSYEGRPQQDTLKGADAAAALSKNPPSRILFVGNLSFDTSEDNLREHFGAFGDIVKVRMATFEDLGKCKGFAFIDYKDEEGPTTALKLKLAKKLINRPLRLEYGEDRSKRTPNYLRKQHAEAAGEEAPADASPASRNFEPRVRSFADSPRPQGRERPAPKRRSEDQHMASNKRIKSSVALATAPRASAAIVELKGKKIKFD